MKILTDYAMSFLGSPYIWGGDDPTGWDCSGLVQEILASVNMDPPGDQTASGLYAHFMRERHTLKAKAGSLAFYGKTKISHVAFMIDDWRVIEAGGGGSKTRTADDAAAQNAFVRIRPVYRRTDLVRILHPDYNLA